MRVSTTLNRTSIIAAAQGMIALTSSFSAILWIRALIGISDSNERPTPKIPARKPVIIVSVDIRRYFRKMIEKDYYELPVLSFQELSAEINIQPLGRLKL